MPEVIMTDWLAVALGLFLGIPACFGWALGIATLVDLIQSRRKMLRANEFVRGYNAMLQEKAWLERPSKKIRRIFPKDAA